ncbi:MAG TPA: GspE/PulE family protein [Planctomycetaceae bacterium]|nr:GspE/PulE family protein [Planctomycetaceae bacterium]
MTRLVTRSPHESLAAFFSRYQPAGNAGEPASVPELVGAILNAARDIRASDVHLVPAEDGLHMSWRLDGVLLPVAQFDRRLAGNIVSRLKVLAELLTYKTDVPQEGRIRQAESGVETRVSTFPTLFGEKAVVRLFVASGQYRTLDELGLPHDIETVLRQLLDETGGVILVTGPAGSGKTTTLYACLRELAGREQHPRSLVTLEDPVEAVLPGVAQSPIRPAAGFDYQTGLRSLLRQDPDAIMVGEIRDRPTAEIVFQAALTGHLVLTTFHAGSAAEAVGRLLDMGIEPYQLRSGILAVINQRLVRRLCDCAKPSADPADRLGLDVERLRLPAGCENCSGTGYRERIVLAEMLRPDAAGLGPAILSRGSSQEVERLAVESGMISRHRRAADAVEAGQTSPAEVRRVLGFR